MNARLYKATPSLTINFDTSSSSTLPSKWSPSHRSPISSADTSDSPTKRRSWICETIREEPFESPSSSPTEDSETYNKRYHKPRSPLARTQSAPQLLSTTTTQPIHIHNLMYVSFPKQ